jgi:hypothetical protein
MFHSHIFVSSPHSWFQNYRVSLFFLCQSSYACTKEGCGIKLGLTEMGYEDVDSIQVADYGVQRLFF